MKKNYIYKIIKLFNIRQEKIKAGQSLWGSSAACSGVNFLDGSQGGFNKDFHIQQEVVLLRVFYVEAFALFFRHVGFAAGFDLPQAGDSGGSAKAENGFVCRQLFCFVEGEGRLPTSDISPLSTLSNWGSSSRLVERINWPTRVILGRLSF